MPIYRAAWVLPIVGPPIRDAGVGIDHGRIAAIHTAPFPPAADVIDLGDAAILPGLVNAHTHLELSWLRGRVPPRARFDEWVRDVMRVRREGNPAIIQRAITGAIAEACASGTSLVGDITNTLATVTPLLASDLGGVVFREVIGFQRAKAEEVVSRAVAQLQGIAWTNGLRGALCAHAPYSVSPAAFRTIAQHVEANGGITSVHVAESPEEVEFVKTAGGAPRAVLEELQVWDATWQAPACSPVEYLDRLGYLGRQTLAVHCVQATSDDLALLRDRGVTLVTCPRSNRWTGAGDPPVAAFFNSGVRMAIGTDSLASAPDLNLFAELAEARRLAPDAPAGALLRAATLSGAEALGFADEYGSIEMGKRARLIAVEVPRSPQGVEEYLLSGVTPDHVKWIGEEGTRDQGRGPRD